MIVILIFISISFTPTQLLEYDILTILMHVAVVLSFSLNHAEDIAGDNAETSTERIPFKTAHECAAVIKTISFVDRTLIHAPTKARPVTIESMEKFYTLPRFM